MSVTITVGWWIVPTIITALAYAWAFWPSQNTNPTVGDGVVGAILLLVGTIISLIAWLAWSLLS